MTMNLYYVTAYHWENNEWWRFAITATSNEDAVQKLTGDFSDTKFTRTNARYICTTTANVFEEL
jgi:hypothetical protein